MKKPTIWKLHSLLGLITGVPLLVIAVTGSVLVFKHELDLLLVPEQVGSPSEGQTRQDLDNLIAGYHRAVPDYHIVGWALFPDDPERADVVFAMKDGTNDWTKSFVNGYTGELLHGPRGLEAGITDWVLSLHYTFLGGHLGMLIVGLLAVLMCALGVTGILVYKRFWLSLFTLNRKNLRVLMGDMHRKVGIFSAPVFFILGLTGAWWNLTHAVRDLTEHGLGEEDPVLSERFYNTDLSFDGLTATCAEQVPGFRTGYISFPRDAEAPLAFYGQVPDRAGLRSPYGIFQRFDATTGEPGTVYDIREAGVAEQTLDAFVPLHFGTFGGLFTKLLWCVLGLSPGFLAVSGFVVTWRRSRGRRRAPAKRPEARGVVLEPQPARD